MSDTLAGVIPILATPFLEDGSIDVPSQLSLVDHLLETGVHGLAAFGNAAEGYTLLPDERETLLKEIVKRIDGRAPLVVGVGATGTDAAIAVSREAEDSGADALMVLPPYFLKPDGEGLLFFFEAISNRVRIPIMVQDAPLLSQVPMPAALLARMGKEIEHVRFVKIEAPPTAPKVSQVLAGAAGSLAVFGGLNGQFMIEEIQRGACGTMPAADMTLLFVDIWNALQSGDVERAWRCFTRALPLIRYELQPGLGVSAIKHNLVSQGLFQTATVRHPTRPLDAEGLRELEVLRSQVWPAGVGA